MISKLIFQDFKKNALLLSLLAQPMLVNAAPSAAEAEISADAVYQQQNSDGFPARAVRQQVNRTIVPPPPPGPYMSLGLNDFPVGGPSFDHNESQSESAAAISPIEVFSPDIPWPENLRPPKRWMPEQGYRYVEPRAQTRPEVKPYPPVQTMPQYNYQYGYQSYQNMSGPDPRRMPVMPPRSASSYYPAGDFASGYRNPVQDSRMQQGAALYRTPPQLPGQQ